MQIGYRPAGFTALIAAAALAMAITPGAAALAGAGAAGRAVVAPAAARAAVQAIGQAGAVPGGTQLWVQRFAGGAGRSAAAESVAASPNGSVVYVTGLTTASPKPLRNQVTVAYDAATGAQLWIESYQGKRNHPRRTATVTVSPDGATVFVATDIPYSGEFDAYLVIAYDASTGAQRWLTKGEAFSSVAQPGAVVISPNSKAVYVTGSTDSHHHKVFTTMALNAVTGAALWDAMATFPPHVQHVITSIAVSPDGSTVFIGGSSATIAYAAATGKQLWIDPYKLAFDRGQVSLAVSPDSATLYATGHGMAKGSDSHYWTAALDTATGARRWTATYQGPEGVDNGGTDAIALSPDGSAVYVTGAATRGEYTTIAYAATTGAQMWLAQSPNAGGSSSTPAYLAISPDGSKLAVTGTSDQANGASGYSTAVLAAATGARLWIAAYQDPGGVPTRAAGVAFSHSGAQVVVTGSSIPASGPSEFATVAYQS